MRISYERLDSEIQVATLTDSEGNVIDRLYCDGMMPINDLLAIKAMIDKIIADTEGIDGRYTMKQYVEFRENGDLEVSKQ